MFRYTIKVYDWLQYVITQPIHVQNTNAEYTRSERNILSSAVFSLQL